MSRFVPGVGRLLSKRSVDVTKGVENELRQVPDTVTERDRAEVLAVTGLIEATVSATVCDEHVHIVRDVGVDRLQILLGLEFERAIVFDFAPRRG